MTGKEIQASHSRKLTAMEEQAVLDRDRDQETRAGGLVETRSEETK